MAQRGAGHPTGPAPCGDQPRVISQARQTVRAEPAPRARPAGPVDCPRTEWARLTMPSAELKPDFTGIFSSQ